MKVTKFYLKEMDCASEEQLVCMELEGHPGIHQLIFQLPEQMVEVYHEHSDQQILEWLEELDLGSQLIGSREIEDDLSTTVNLTDSQKERKVLWLVFGINLFFFFLEMSYGYLANTMSVVADGLDMLADSLVYGLALLAVGQSQTVKQGIIKVAAYFQMTLAFLGLANVILRFMNLDYLPDIGQMMLISLGALLGNGLCLWLLNRQHSSEMHMRASQIFTSNDLLINLGVILTGLLVCLTQSPLPDLLVGILVFIMVMRGGLRILHLSKS
ncbi:cation transporter [Streptococcus sp. X16XC17]|uniref:cation transporter n=1 Tax=unclassified Streptococcus TaxID=2608887 RepID=UPI00066FB6B4|nr:MULTISPECIES: cation transporter [unclassified Streptococcus]TCD45636.1 cation transporter [Streptococcus sp. X16XC17]